MYDWWFKRQSLVLTEVVQERSVNCRLVVIEDVFVMLLAVVVGEIMTMPSTVWLIRTMLAAVQLCTVG